MSVLIVLGVITDVAYSHRVGPDDLFVAEVFSPSDPLHKLATNFTLELSHYLLSALLLARAVQPRHRLVLAIKIALPLLEGSVINSPLPSGACFILRVTPSPHR